VGKRTFNPLWREWGEGLWKDCGPIMKREGLESGKDEERREWRGRAR